MSPLFTSAETFSDSTPSLHIPKSKVVWERRRSQIRSELVQLLGTLPPRPKSFAVRSVSKEDCGDYLLEKLEFENGAGALVPGLILSPKSGGKHPAILYCHYHGGDYGNGKQELFKTWPAEDQPGPSLARLGYVVMAIDAYGFGERSGRGPGGPNETGEVEELTSSKFHLWHGRTLWGMMLRDDLMALDHLASRSNVDARRLGVTGMSMGATRAWWLMALDERIHTGVAVACLTRYQNLIQEKALQAHGIYYFIPGMLRYFDTEAVVSLIAPRPLLLLNGDQDIGSPISGIRQINAAVQSVYKLYSQEAAFVSEIYAGLGHQYTPEMWRKTLAWFAKELA